MVYVGSDQNGVPIYRSAFLCWTASASRHVYRSIVFTKSPVPADAYNLYRGLGVVPRPGPCQRILDHIEEVVCAGNETDFEAMLNLKAWQIQHIGEPSRIIVVLHNPNHQAGKGVFLEEVALKIYGPSGFFPSSASQVLGKYNDTLRGKSFVLCDEVMFAGDQRAMNALKALSTTTIKGLEGKNLPIIEYPLGVNLWLSSNAETPVHLETGDARHWILRTSEHRIGDHAYFAKLMDEIRNGERRPGWDCWGDQLDSWPMAAE